MSEIEVNEQSYASGRYSKRKRTQVTYYMDELDVSDSESDFEEVQAKKRKTVKRKALPKSKIFPFMELPSEIRNIIYGYALEDPSGINLVATFRNKRRTVERVSAETQSQISGGTYSYSVRQMNDELRNKREAPVALVPSLLAVCKQIYQESRDILYGNEFIFADTFALYSLLINLGPAGAKNLKKLRVMEWGHGRATKAYNHSCFAVLVWATNLKILHLDKPSGRARNPKNVADQFYRDAFPWLEAVGMAKGKVDAAVDVLRIDAEEFDYIYYRQSNQNLLSAEEKRDQFLGALAKLLGAQQKRVMGARLKKRKMVRDEL